jgi:hypothetical protein
VRDQVSHPYKTTGSVYFNIYILNCMVPCVPQMPLIYSDSLIRVLR